MNEGKKRMAEEKETVQIIEGFAEDVTPIAFDAAKQMKAATDAWNAEGGDLQSLVTTLQGQQRVLLKAIGALELQAASQSGRVIMR